MQKIDPRVKRTRRLLGDALVSLILEDGYESITIKAITERAEVAYITFFRHYDSIDELLMEVLEGGLSDLRTEIERMAAETDANPLESEGSLIFEHVEQHADLFHILLSSPGAGAIRKRVRDMIAAIFLATCRPLSQDDSLIPGDVAAHHIAVSLLALIEWWLAEKMPYPTERMGAIYRYLITSATVTAVQLAA